jgi:hypothetical protein
MRRRKRGRRATSPRQDSSALRKVRKRRMMARVKTVPS